MAVLKQRVGCWSLSPAMSGHGDAEARRSVLTALPCATLVTWQVARVMAVLKQRVGRWSLRGHSVKARQVTGTEMRGYISQRDCTEPKVHPSLQCVPDQDQRNVMEGQALANSSRSVACSLSRHAEQPRAGPSCMHSLIHACIHSFVA